MINIQFYCRPCKAGVKGFAPIEVSVNNAGDRVIVSTVRKERPADFKKAMTSRQDTDIRRFCDAVRKNLNEAITERTVQGRTIDKQFIVDCVRHGGVREKKVCEVIAEFMEFQKQKVGVTMLPEQYRKYEIAYDILGRYVGEDKPFAVITNGVIYGFINHLIYSLNYKSATAKSVCVKVKALTAFAIGEGYLRKDPFNTITMPRAEAREEWLSDSDLDLIRDLDVKSEAIERSRDLFLFQCNTGVSFADMSKLTEADFTCENGIWSVTKTRTKTGVRYTSVILPEGVEILRKYNFQLPMISPQKYNLNLLKIEYMVGLDKHLHSHLGRKVYGTALLRGGCSMKAVSKALGHSSSKVTETSYAFLQDRDVIREISEKFHLGNCAV